MTHSVKTDNKESDTERKERKGNNLGKEIKSAALHWSMDSK